MIVTAGSSVSRVVLGMLDRVVVGLRMRILFEEFFCWTRYLIPGALRSANDVFGSVSSCKLCGKCELSSGKLWMFETEVERKSMPTLFTKCKRGLKMTIKAHIECTKESPTWVDHRILVT